MRHLRDRGSGADAGDIRYHRVGATSTLSAQP